MTKIKLFTLCVVLLFACFVTAVSADQDVKMVLTLTEVNETAEEFIFTIEMDSIPLTWSFSPAAFTETTIPTARKRIWIPKDRIIQNIEIKGNSMFVFRVLTQMPEGWVVHWSVYNQQPHGYRLVISIYQTPLDSLFGGLFPPDALEHGAWFEGDEFETYLPFRDWITVYINEDKMEVVEIYIKEDVRSLSYSGHHADGRRYYTFSLIDKVPFDEDPLALFVKLRFKEAGGTCLEIKEGEHSFGGEEYCFSIVEDDRGAPSKVLKKRATTWGSIKK